MRIKQSSCSFKMLNIHSHNSEKIPHLYFFLSSRFLLAANFNTIVLKIPLLKRCSINLNNGTLHQSLCPDQFIIGCIINDIQNPSLAGDSLTTPRLISSVQPQSTPLDIATSNTYPPNSLVARQFSVGRLPS